MTTKEILNITKKLHLLYVEDDVDMQRSSIALFNNFFDDIVVANNGIEALQKYEKNVIDIIITDIAMPQMDGIEFIQKIRASNKIIPIIVYSAWNNPAYMSACISLNIDGYIVKPIKSENFIEMLRKVAQRISSTDYQQSLNIDFKNREFIDKKFNVDSLTNLKSHNMLIERLDKVSQRDMPVVVLINIDEFHIYNEIYGLEVGDKILYQFAVLLQSYVEKKKYYDLYRLSGDEFVLYESVHVIDSDKYIEDIEELCNFIESQRIAIEGVKETITLSVTVGIAFTHDNIFAHADMALKEARARGRRYLGFSAELDRRAELKKNLYWREELNRAIEQNRVHAYYQAIVDKDKNILKYESLIRIKQPQEDGSIKVVTPTEFLNFSKMSRQYLALTTIMIKESFQTMLDKNVHIAINITYHDVENKEINRLLRDYIKKHQLASRVDFDISSQVIFELLENPNHNDYNKFVEFIEEFKELGVLIAIDNFGLGFSNIAKIAELSPHYVKIDSSLIKNIDTDKHSYGLVKAIVKFTNELGIRTIAEHVSTEKIFQKCVDIGIDGFQGYYFSEPIEDILI
jgi:diguanylate cyclase (GGDEF)-like protein